jgi:hypothetical protein
MDKDALKKKLRDKLKEKKTERKTQLVRQKQYTNLKEKLKKTLDEEERKKIESTIDMLERIEEKEFNSFGGEFAEYNDSYDCGGSMVRND